MKENEEKKNVSNRKAWSIFGFLISILLLTIAIVLSMNEAKATREAKINMNSSIEQASSEMGKTVNEVKSSNKIKNEVNSLNEINENEIRNNTSNETNSLDNQNSNEINKTSVANTQEDNNEESVQSNQSVEDVNNQENESKNEENQNNEEQQNATNNTSNEQFIMPIEGEISSSYSIDNLQYSNTLQEWITHRGIDIKADKTTVVKASRSGTVKYIKEDPRYGLSITIEHSDGFQTVYSSLLSTEFVKEGDKVEQGQSIGTVGNSAVFESAEGSHLHFEILKDGEYVNPDIYLK